MNATMALKQKILDEYIVISQDGPHYLVVDKGNLMITIVLCIFTFVIVSGIFIFWRKYDNNRQKRKK